MRLTERQVEILAFRIVKTLVEERYLETRDREALEEHVKGFITEELSVEDRLNDEVRQILSQHERTMREQEITYHEMFQKVKNKLARERGIIL